MINSTSQEQKKYCDDVWSNHTSVQPILSYSQEVYREIEQENSKEIESDNNYPQQNHINLSSLKPQKNNKIREQELTICLLEEKGSNRKEDALNKKKLLGNSNQSTIRPQLGWKEISLQIPHCLDESFCRRFVLYGDFYFDLSNEGLNQEEQKFLTSNKYKPNLSVEQNLKYDCVYLNIGTQRFNLGLPKYSDHLVHLLNSKQDQFQHSLAELLKEYSTKADQIQFSYQKIKRLHQNSPNFFKERARLFEKYCDEVLENLEKENKIYLLVKRKLNQETGNLEYYQYVLSKGLIFLLGLDVPSFVQMTMRSGRPNIFDSMSNIHFIEHQLQYILNSKLHHTSEEIKVVTLDGSLIPIKMQFFIHDFKDKFPLQYQALNDYSLLNVLGVIEIDVDPAIIQQLLQNREEKQIKINQEISLLTQSPQYNEESYQFLLKYYLYNYSNQVTYKQFLKKRNK